MGTTHGTTTHSSNPGVRGLIRSITVFASLATGCITPLDGVKNDDECESVNLNYCEDGDGDGFGDMYGMSTPFCLDTLIELTGESTPTTFSVNGTQYSLSCEDCDDNDPTVNIGDCGPEGTAEDDTGSTEDDTGSSGSIDWPEPDGCVQEVTNYVATYSTDARDAYLANEDDDLDSDGVPASRDCDDTDPSKLGLYVQTTSGSTYYTDFSSASSALVPGATLGVCGWWNDPDGLNLNLGGSLNGETITVLGVPTFDAVPGTISSSQSSGIEIDGSVTVNVVDLLVWGNSASSSDNPEWATGGGSCLRAEGGAVVNATALICSNNSSGGLNGGILLNDANLNSTNSYISDSHAGDGAGLYLAGDSYALWYGGGIVSNGTTSAGNGIILTGADSHVNVTQGCVGGNAPHDLSATYSPMTHDFGFDGSWFCDADGQCPRYTE